MYNICYYIVGILINIKFKKKVYYNIYFKCDVK